jgi:DNA-binding FadR family transcriptional regulator
MERAWSGVQALMAPALANELRDTTAYRALSRAVAAGDVERARREARKLVSKGEDGLTSLLGVKKEKKR